MLAHLIARLESEYGRPEAPTYGAFELVVRENIAYLANDETRDSAMAKLKDSIGITPRSILSADSEALVSIASHGILPQNSVSKLRRIAEIAMEEWDGDLDRALDLPPAKAVNALTRFPSIGRPGAEKILLFAGRYAVLAVDSNGLRVLLRLGYGEDKRSYQAAYRSAQAAASRELPAESATLIRAHMLLRRHGKEICKTSNPRCGICAVADKCPSAERPAANGAS